MTLASAVARGGSDMVELINRLEETGLHPFILAWVGNYLLHRRQHLMESLKSLLREGATLADVALSIRVEMPSGPAAFLFLRPFKRVCTVSLEHSSLYKSKMRNKQDSYMMVIGVLAPCSLDVAGI